MIRITLEETSKTVCLIVEGKLSGECVSALESVTARVREDRADKQLVIDLAGVSSMDASGRSLMGSLRAGGVRMQNLDPLSESLLTMEREEAGTCRV